MDLSTSWPRLEVSRGCIDGVSIGVLTTQIGFWVFLVVLWKQHLGTASEHP